MFLFFFIPLLLLGFLLDYIFSAGLRKEDYNRNRLWNAIFFENINSNAIIMGNSRACYQYNPQILDSILHLNFYNLGIDGHAFNYQLICYNTYRRFHPKPKIIIQNIDFATLEIQKGDNDQFLPYVFDDTLMSELGDISTFSLIDRKIPLLRFSGQRKVVIEAIQSYNGKKIKTNSVKGFEGKTDKYNGNNMLKNNIFYYKINNEAIQIFEKYLDNCHKDGIKVILVSAPLYVEAKRKIYDFKGIQSMLNMIAIKHNLKILDYTNDPICSDTSYFYNAAHLNIKGADIFSSKLANDISRLQMFRK